jgi:catechol 2,3-dioxygenase-like lactoylglutathione lyase family enzyme
MNITSLEELVFGVDDVGSCNEFLANMGLDPVARDDRGGLFLAEDGTGISIRPRADASLPEPLETGSMLRETVYGAADIETIEAVANEMSRDRAVIREGDGSISFYDDLGFALRIRISTRKMLDVPAEVMPNVPNSTQSRGLNVIGVTPGAPPARPRTLSHVVYFVPDVSAAEAFYTERLGFRCTDRFTDVGPFLRPAGMADHHALFLIQTPPHMKGIEHFAFHMASSSQVLAAGTQMVKHGFQSFWGPGRHHFGSNWFWYFNCPMGCHAEFDADMDQHDDHWIPRTAAMGPESSQAYLFQVREKWAPGGPPPNVKPAG